MEKQLKIGGSLYKVDYTSENAFKALDLLLEWMQHPNHYAAHSGEGIMQDDDCQIDAPVLVSDIIDDILKPEFLGDEDDTDDFF